MRLGWSPIVGQRAELGIRDADLIVVDHVGGNVDQSARPACADEVVGASGVNRARDVVGGRRAAAFKVTGDDRVLQCEGGPAAHDINSATSTGGVCIIVGVIGSHSDAGQRSRAGGAVVVDAAAIVIGFVAADGAVR